MLIQVTPYHAQAPQSGTQTSSSNQQRNQILQIVLLASLVILAELLKSQQQNGQQSGQNAQSFPKFTPFSFSGNTNSGQANHLTFSPNDTSSPQSPSTGKFPESSLNKQSPSDHSSSTGNGAENGNSSAGSKAISAASPATTGSKTPSAVFGADANNTKQVNYDNSNAKNPPNVVNKPIIVHSGEVFNGKGATFLPGKSIGDGSQNEHQKPLFIVENGGTLKNVNMSGGDGVHFLGSGKMINCHNTNVGEDAVTIDGTGNRQHDGRIAGDKNALDAKRPTVEIIDSSFSGAADKVVQDNAAANILLNGVQVNGAGKVVRTNGGDTSLNSDVDITNSQFKNIKEAVFRTDAPGAHVSFNDVTQDAPKEVLAVNPQKQSTSAVSEGTKAYTG